MGAEANPELKQQRMKEFMSLLPLTVEIAGLPKASVDRLYTADQMEARVLSIRTAYKQARALMKELAEG